MEKYTKAIEEIIEEAKRDARIEMKYKIIEIIKEEYEDCENRYRQTLKTLKRTDLSNTDREMAIINKNFFDDCATQTNFIIEMLENLD